ncbi:MarR family winged helix-turn-helix transcriptional regulator [Rhodococcus sp. Q]|uniref:MarR family winged helix-turn-helix transcriptional regulator n=1 Tax=Rhodococcus sp. Q TaxID=2502252 RepID=UPI0010F903D8|nr:MarR family winged helix-turn-helix transcriptional regulator [Rhodococcus sp. Q]
MDSPVSAPRLSDRPGYQLVKAAMKVRQQYAETLAGLGLLPNHHAILSILNELGPCHQKELAHRVVVDPGDIVAYLDGLQKPGLVSRERDPEDRRRQIVTITPAGLRRLRDADAALDELEQSVFGVLAARDRVTLAKLSSRLAESL